MMADLTRKGFLFCAVCAMIAIAAAVGLIATLG